MLNSRATAYQVPCSLKTIYLNLPFDGVFIILYINTQIKYQQTSKNTLINQGVFREFLGGILFLKWHTESKEESCSFGFCFSCGHNRHSHRKYISQFFVTCFWKNSVLFESYSDIAYIIDCFSIYPTKIFRARNSHIYN